MTEDSVGWLVREVRDLLDASSVGLYEFIWLLRSEQPSLAVDERQKIAGEALRRLLSDGAGRLVLLTWPSHDSEGDADPSTFDVVNWDDPSQGEPYVALARN
jgi:hypothetical protein